MSSPGILGQLAQRLRSGERLLTAWVGSTDPAIAEQLARAGFDAVTFDFQHGAMDFASASAGIVTVAMAGRPSLARIAVGDFATAARLCDAGVSGIIAPMIDSAADARKLVEYIKFAPVGGRSWGPRRVLPLSGLDEAAYLQQANAMHLAIAMIETQAGYDQLDAILAVDGIDGVFVGPADLSIALCNGAAVTPTGATIEAQLDHVVARAAAHGKFAATFCHNGARVKALFARGYALCTPGTDLKLMRMGAEAEIAAAR